MTMEGGGEGGKERGKKTRREKKQETRRGRETERWRGQRKPVGLQRDCDHASWISISKQNKYSPSLLLLPCSSHKPFQVPCRPFPHHDLYLLASSLLGSPLSYLLCSQRQLSFIPSLFAPFLAAFLQLSLFSQHQVFFLFTFLPLTNLPSLCHCVCLHACTSVTFSLSG